MRRRCESSVAALAGRHLEKGCVDGFEVKKGLNKHS